MAPFDLTGSSGFTVGGPETSCSLDTKSRAFGRCATPLVKLMLLIVLLVARTRHVCTGSHSHYQTDEFSLHLAILTTGPMNSHYLSLFSLPGQ